MTESELSTLLIPYANSPEGKVVIDTFRATVTALFPHYLDELRGIAVGAQVSYENVRVCDSCNGIIIGLRCFC